ncbi:hypothetical protein CANARDRAFT_30392 [[Candida] arabinofermentans NRRL YB-2248]|uniref:Uncharacterized protein n=1 Tax=[Candida] arabinofermentans NRRL YB-2248 TaxID=983967 RepID=A0A1E4SU66_9ASCO|nr:hypothetical protein CANARDRAFT_30392 [[Candida] arabinofermentans NRRL YB-2248]
MIISRHAYLRAQVCNESEKSTKEEYTQKKKTDKKNINEIVKNSIDSIQVTTNEEEEPMNEEEQFSDSMEETTEEEDVKMRC